MWCYSGLTWAVQGLKGPPSHLVRAGLSWIVLNTWPDTVATHNLWEKNADTLGGQLYTNYCGVLECWHFGWSTLHKLLWSVRMLTLWVVNSTQTTEECLPCDKLGTLERMNNVFNIAHQQLWGTVGSCETENYLKFSITTALSPVALCTGSVL